MAIFPYETCGNQKIETFFQNLCLMKLLFCKPFPLSVLCLVMLLQHSDQALGRTHNPYFPIQQPMTEQLQYETRGVSIQPEDMQTSS